MYPQQELDFIKEAICNLLSFECNYNIEITDDEDVYAKLSGDTLYIGAKNKSCYARALTLAAKEIAAGETEFEIKQHGRFKTCGALIDMSRNGVMTVGSLKEYMLPMRRDGRYGYYLCR